MTKTTDPNVLLTDFTPAIGTNSRSGLSADQWQYVLVWQDGSTDESGFVFDGEKEAQGAAVVAIKRIQSHALRVAVDHAEYVAKGLIAAETGK